MPPSPSPDELAGRRAPFVCRWRLQGRAAASIRVAGEVDLATAGGLEDALREALGYARLILLDVHEMTFMDLSGVHVICDAVARARTEGAHIVFTGVTAQVERLLDLADVRAQVDVLETRHLADGPPRAGRGARNGWTPLDNSVNDRVLTARVMSVSDARLWMQAADGTIHRPWAPAAAGLPVPRGSDVELYLDATGAVNGWYEPRSGLAVNQRGLEPGESPATHADMACAGPCEIVWLAPAASRLAERRERCLTCAGPLVHR